MNTICSSLVRFTLVVSLFYPSITVAQTPSAASTPADTLKQLQAEIDLLKLKNAELQEKQQGLATKADLSQIKEKEAAANEAAIATSRATVAAQQAAALKSMFPTDKVTPLEGKITADKDYTFPPQLLAYSASQQLASGIALTVIDILRARQTTSHAEPRILIYQTSDALPGQRAAYGQLLQRAEFIGQKLGETHSQFTLAKDTIQKLGEPKQSATEFINKAKATLSGPGARMIPVGGLDALKSANDGMTAVNSTLQTLIQLISLFRTDTTITSASVSLDVDALSAQLGYALQSSRLAPIVEYPSLLSVIDSPAIKALYQMSEKQSLVSPDILNIDTLVAQVNTRQVAVEEQIKQQLPLGTPPSEEISKILVLATKLAKDDQQVNQNRLADLRQRLVSFDQLAGGMDKSLQIPDEKTGTTALLAILKTEALLLELDRPNTYSLLIKVVAAGGATQIDRNLFTGSKMRHLGGAVFVVTLADRKGTILFTNVPKGFLGYSKLVSTGGNIEQDIQTRATRSGRAR